MRKMIIPLALGLAVLSTLSCGSQGGNGDMSSSTSGSNVYLVDAARKSCKALADAAASSTTASDDVTAISFSMPQVTITVPTSRRVKIQYVAITLTGSALSGGKYNCPKISGDSLLSSFMQVSGKPAYNGTDLIMPSATQTAPAYGDTSKCNITCGGVTMEHPEKSASGSGRIVVYGENLDDGSGVTSDSYFQWDYTGTD